MSVAFIEMMANYRKRKELVGADMWELTNTQTGRLYLIEQGFMSINETDAHFLIQALDFNAEEEAIVRDAIVEQRPSSRTRFGEFIQLYRLKHNMILGEMTKIVKASNSYASGVEHGRYPLEKAYIEKLIEKLIFTEEEEEQLRGFVPHTIIR